MYKDHQLNGPLTLRELLSVVTLDRFYCDKKMDGRFNIDQDDILHHGLPGSLFPPSILCQKPDLWRLVRLPGGWSSYRWPRASVVDITEIFMLLRYVSRCRIGQWEAG